MSLDIDQTIRHFFIKVVIFMETNKTSIEPKNIIDEKDPLKQKKAPTWAGAIISWFVKDLETNPEKATQGYLNDPWAGPIGH